ncbi:MAG: TonB family protein [Alphaproteobacteria bacterium]|nr:TonB family protein [Alphaproteobacteria bacterium]
MACAGDGWLSRRSSLAAFLAALGLHVVVLASLLHPFSSAPSSVQGRPALRLAWRQDTVIIRAEAQKPSPPQRPAPELPQPERALRAKPRVPKPVRRPLDSATPRGIADSEETAGPIPAAGALALDAATRDERLRLYASQIWERISAHKPRGVGRAGSVSLTFRLEENGRLASLVVARSSGDAMLDALALSAIRSSAPFEPAPAGLLRDDLLFTIALDFS